MFQHTAARRRLPAFNISPCLASSVSTHSRPKAAAVTFHLIKTQHLVSTHSRAEAAADGFGGYNTLTQVSTHSRAEAAARVDIDPQNEWISFNTQPRGGGCAVP